MDDDDVLGGVDDVGGTDAPARGPKAARQAAQDLEFCRVRLSRVMKTLVRIMHHRCWKIVTVNGQKVETEKDVEDRVADFSDPHVAMQAEESQAVVMTCVTDTGISAMAALLQAINVDTMRDVQQTMDGAGIGHAILIARNRPTHIARKMLTDSVEFFTMANLQASIADHALQPRHIRLNEAQTRRVRERFRNAKFPRMFDTDPMARFLNLHPGDVVMVLECMGREQPIWTFFDVVPGE